MEARRKICRWRPVNESESTPTRLLGFGFITLITWFAVPTPAAAQNTIHVPGDQPTIQAAIDAAANGDTVLVSDGTYKENIDFKGKAITVKSVNGASTTTVDGGNLDVVVKFTNREGPSSVLDGFTVTHGNSVGIFILSTSPTIKNNLITTNTGCQGVGINIGDGSPFILSNTITNNAQTTCTGGASSGGIGIGGPPAGAQIIGNTITGNNSSLGTGGGGISLNAVGPVLIQGNFINGNVGYRAAELLA